MISWSRRRNTWAKTVAARSTGEFLDKLWYNEPRYISLELNSECLSWSKCPIMKFTSGSGECWMACPWSHLSFVVSSNGDLCLLEWNRGKMVLLQPVNLSNSHFSKLLLHFSLPFSRERTLNVSSSSCCPSLVAIWYTRTGTRYDLVKMYKLGDTWMDNREAKTFRLHLNGWFACCNETKDEWFSSVSHK